MIKVHFSNGQEDPDEYWAITLGPFEGVQLTYDSLRDTGNGESFATFTGGYWRVDDDFHHSRKYSDVTFEIVDELEGQSMKTWYMATIQVALDAVSEDDATAQLEALFDDSSAEWQFMRVGSQLLTPTTLTLPIAKGPFTK